MALYKYVTPDRIDIISNELIRFTQPDALNDPWETRPYIESMITDDALQKDIIERIQKDEIITKFSESQWNKLNPIQKKITTPKEIETYFTNWANTHPTEFETEYNRILKETIDTFKANQPIMVKGIPEGINKTLGILSLTRDPDNLLMWAHYTNNHAGFVIEFDENHTFFSPRQSGGETLFGLKDVKYYEERPHIEALLGVSWNWDLLFTFKSKPWEYEKECRMIQLLSKADQIINNPAGNIYLFSIQTESIKSIIFGLRMSNIDKQKIIQLVNNDIKYSHIKLFNTTMEDNSFSISIKPIKYLGG